MAKKKIASKENSFTEILLYNTPNGKVKVEIYLQNETVWLTQQKIAELFGVQRPAITKHLKNIFETGELKEEVVSSILEHTIQHGAIEGKTQETKVKYYNSVSSAFSSFPNSGDCLIGVWPRRPRCIDNFKQLPHRLVFQAERPRTGLTGFPNKQ